MMGVNVGFIRQRIRKCHIHVIVRKPQKVVLLEIKTPPVLAQTVILPFLTIIKPPSYTQLIFPHPVKDRQFTVVPVPVRDMLPRIV